MTWAPELAKVDARFFQTLRGRESAIGQDREDDGITPINPPRFMTKDAFLSQMLGELQVKIVTGEGENKKVTYKDAAQLWLRHPGRRRYWGVEFNPKPKSGSKLYNMWKGFQVQPKAGDWSLMRKHIEHEICRDNPEQIAYVMGWLARGVQKPELPGEVALVLRGEKGAGKGTLANAYGRLFEPHFMAISNKEHLVGRFNAHLKSTIVLFVDEGFWAGDVQKEGVLKQLITEPDLPVEAKYVDLENAPNRLHIIMASNENWVVPVSGKERRYCVLDVSPERAGDMAYFDALRAEMANGGTEAMMHDLLQFDISQFQHRVPPATEGLHAQMVLSLRGFDAWWYGKLVRGRIDDGTPWKGATPVSLNYLFDDLVKSERRNFLSLEGFLLDLKRAAPGLETYEVMAGGKVRMVKLPPLEKCRAEWDRTHSGQEKWDNG